MGREKKTPTKRPAPAEIKYLDYIPAVKKRKSKSQVKEPKTYKLIWAQNEAHYHIGNFEIGTTNNELPESIPKNFKAQIKEKNEDVQNDSLILEFDNFVVVVQLFLNTDLSLLKDLFSTAHIAYKFIFDENVSLEVYFTSIPLPRLYSKTLKLTKRLFEKFYEIKEPEFEQTCPEGGQKEILTFYSKLAQFKPSLSSENVQHPYLKPTLRPYQKDAVNWMLKQETNLNENQQNLHPLYNKVRLKSGQDIYYDRFSGHLQLEEPKVTRSIKGGILADEMGLGKTVEVLALLLMNPKNSNQFETPLNKSKKVIVESPRKRRPKSSKPVEESKPELPDPNDKSQMRKALETWYKIELNQVSANRSKQYEKLLVQCICGDLSEEGLVKCSNCDRSQHSYCVGYSKNLGIFRCAQCWLSEPLVPVKGTLIVTPRALRTQWSKEISKHIEGGIKVLLYDGFTTTPIYPTKLADYDVVITTYNILQNELRLTENEGVQVNFRRERKYSAPGCPLVRVSWWRLCLDEAQTVDSPTTMISVMAKKLDAKYRWAVTGTPISKRISDLYGLMEYLQIEPYNDRSTWDNILYYPYLEGQHEPLCKFLAEIFWRNSKQQVIDQINIPKQTYVEHFLEFSAVEKYFYKKEHEQSAHLFWEKVQKMDREVNLQSLDRTVLKKILTPLLSLRQTCTYPDTARGRCLASKNKIITMKQLLENLIKKNQTESEEFLRTIVASINGLAGLYLLQNDSKNAVDCYREVLQMSARFNDDSGGKVCLDNLQLIHTLYNLNEVIGSVENLVPTLRDDRLGEDCLKAEQKYLNKFSKQSFVAYEETIAQAKKVQDVEEQFVLKEGQWFSDGIHWLGLNEAAEELLSKVSSNLSNFKNHIRVESEVELLYIIGNWNGEIIDWREDLLKKMSKLYKYEPEGNKIIIDKSLVSKAMDCHLRPDNNKKEKSKCLLCIINSVFKKYEVKLFNIKQRTSTFEHMSVEGAWIPSVEEVCLKTVWQVLKLKNADANILNDGELHLKKIDLLKKELKDLRKLWTCIDQQICSLDEIDICKTRMRLKRPEDVVEKDKKENKVLKNLKYEEDPAKKYYNLVEEHEINFKMALFRTDKLQAERGLAKSLGMQSYLETLRKQQYEGQNPDPCPICKCELKQHWSILLCGHSYCLGCIKLLLDMRTNQMIQCSICRNSHHFNEISYIKSDVSVEDEDTEKIRGNYSTKIEGVIKFLMKLFTANPDDKVIVFSQWKQMLFCLKEALVTNEISCDILGFTKLEEKIEKFKNGKEKVSVLLLPLNLGSKGLNIVEATHVIMLEPLLNPADELQAVGRIHRIGQTKPTFVHKFCIKNTIEENIHIATTTNADGWDKSKVTLGQLLDLFVTESNDQENNETGNNSTETANETEIES